jgi:hypothetical protein
MRVGLDTEAAIAWSAIEVPFIMLYGSVGVRSSIDEISSFWSFTHYVNIHRLGMERQVVGSVRYHPHFTS